jgi:hypothetical protein
MYTGTLIDELISTVERAEQRAQGTDGSQEVRFTYWLATSEREPMFDSKLLGVA